MVGTVGVVGVGLIGGSLGLSLKALKNPPEVVGYDRSATVLADALEREAIDRAASELSELAGCEVIFIAVPVSRILETVESVAGVASPGTILTDVGSTKSKVMAGAGSLLPDNISFIGGHPMAGSELAGVRHASVNLLKNAQYILTPSASTSTGDYKKLHDLLTAMGAQVLALDPVRHDRMMAAISHLPHIAASALVSLATSEAKQDENILLLAAGGFRDITRIASSNPELWVDICIDNAAAILEVLSKYKLQLEKVEGLLRAGDSEGLRLHLEDARRGRQALPAGAELAAEDLRELYIPVYDRPGVISEITLTVGEQGANIEDIEILHSTESVGILRITVAGEENAGKVRRALQGKGFDVQIRRVLS